MTKISKNISFTTPNEENMVISRDVEFDKEGVWDWEVNDVKKYNFLSVLNKGEESYKDHKEQATTLQSLMVSSLPLSYSFNGSSSSGNLSSPPKRIRNLNELYEVTTFIDDDVPL